MAQLTPRSALVGHAVLAILFVLGGLWAVRRVWYASASGAPGWQLALGVLILLGFVSLAVRELRALAALRRHGDGDRPTPSVPPA